MVGGTAPVQHDAGEMFSPPHFLLVLYHSASLSLQRYPGSLPALSDVVLWGCYDYENAAHRQRPVKAAWTGGCCPSSCPLPGLGPDLAPCLPRPLCWRARRSPPPWHRLSLAPSAAPSSPLHAFWTPPLAPCAVARAPSAALGVLKASALPGRQRGVQVRHLKTRRCNRF